MEKIKRYIDVFVPTETCNLRCHYCYITQKLKFNQKIASFSHSPKEIRQALSKEKLGGLCLLNFCALGETMLAEELLQIIYELIQEGHYIMIVTNGTITKAIEKICQWNTEICEHIFFKFSFHFLELKRLNILEKFADNVKCVKKAGCSFTIEITPSDELIPYIDEVKSFSIEKFGALPHLTIARNGNTKGLDLLTNYNIEEYKKIWGGNFNSALFDFKMSVYHKKIKEFCYAGVWSLYLNLESGDVAQCGGLKKIGNIYDDEYIAFAPVGCKCKYPYCYNGHLFLAFGVVPGLDEVNYEQERDRVDSFGNHWLNDSFRSVFSTKLYEVNNQYTELQKFIINQKNWVSTLPSIKELVGKTWIYKKYKRI